MLRKFYPAVVFLGLTLIGQTRETESLKKERPGVVSPKVIDEAAKRQQVSFVIVIASYNNELFVRWNLESALNQNYDNYRIIYIDDCSHDATLALAHEIIDAHPRKGIVTFVENKIRRGALANYYETVVNLCLNNEVVIILDGDDALAHENVLRRLNYAYTKKGKEIWLTYGQFQELNSGARGFCKPMPDHIVRENAFRDWHDTPSHLRTFYAWLCKRINPDDLKKDGDYFAMTYDLALMFPMIELARDHFEFIPDILCLYNDRNPISDHRVNKILQRQIDLYIRALPRYTPLAAAA